MTDKWTPGPWRAGGRGHIVAPDGRGEVTVCKVGAFHDADIVEFNRDRWTADAHLIAAAPDMAEALDDCIDALRDLGAANSPNMIGHGALVAARAALAKARGRT